MSWSRIFPVFLAAVLLLCAGNNYAQQDMFANFEIEKKKAVVELNKFQDKNIARVDALVRVLKTSMFLKQQKVVKPYCDEALAISRNINYAKGLGECYLFIANIYRGSFNDSAAHIYYDSVIQVCHNAADTSLNELNAKANRWKGLMYETKENYYEALSYFFEALKYYERDKGFLTYYLYTDMSNIYLKLNNLQQAAWYAEKAIALSAEKGFNNAYKAGAYLVLTEVLVERRQLSLASYYLDKVQPFVPDSTEMLVNFSYYQKRGEINYLLQKYDSSFVYYQQAAKYAQITGHNLNKTAALYFLSSSALKIGKLDIAKKYADENLALAEKLNATGGKINALMNLSDYYYRTNNPGKAYEFLQRAANLKDSMLSETNIKQINTLSAIYESDKKQKEILQLRNEKEVQQIAVKEKSTLNRIFIATIVGLLIFGYLFYRDFKKGQQIANQQQEIQQQKISELQKDKQLLTVDAMLRGQEEERSRMAKDLHDGLGGMLSGVKLSFVNLKEKLLLPAEYQVNFERSINQLDNTISELRKIAHNLMPEVLVNFGLEEALKDFCRSMQISSGITIVYQQFGENRKLNSQAEVNIYRIVQELVNNALKHAGAKQIIVQLTKNEHKTTVTVEDDGRGFDTKTTGVKKGAGLSNIKNRINYFNGVLDIVSDPGNGTSVSIELIA